jgi:Uma2 family endonuclease
MQIALPELTVPATLILDPEHRLTDEEYVAICEANPSLRLERTARGEIVIVPPAGMESSYRSLGVSGQLREWAIRSGTGIACDSSVEFLLPDGSALSPDAAWVSNKRLATLTKQERRQFPPICPEFVVEVMSPSDRLTTARRKMQTWIANGTDLGWLIDGDNRCVYVFRKGCGEQTLSGVESIVGEGPVEGFVLDLREIWEGL